MGKPDLRAELEQVPRADGRPCLVCQWVDSLPADVKPQAVDLLYDRSVAGRRVHAVFVNHGFGLTLSTLEKHRLRHKERFDA